MRNNLLDHETALMVWIYSISQINSKALMNFKFNNESFQSIESMADCSQVLLVGHDTDVALANNCQGGAFK